MYVCVRETCAFYSRNSCPGSMAESQFFERATPIVRHIHAANIINIFTQGSSDYRETLHQRKSLLINKITRATLGCPRPRICVVGEREFRSQLSTDFDDDARAQVYASNRQKAAGAIAKNARFHSTASGLRKIR